MRKLRIKPIRIGALLHTCKRAVVIVLVGAFISIFLLSSFQAFTQFLKADPGENGLELWRQPVLFNVSNFSWLINNESLCRVDPKLNILLLPVLVHTARSHVMERMAIRKSWGAMPIYRRWDVRLVFLLGEANPNEQNHIEIETALHAEKTKFGDIVLGSFVDSYRNLTYKHLMGYKWILNYCQNANFIIKMDDDIFLDILKWLDRRTTELEDFKTGNIVNLSQLYCFDSSIVKVPIRDNVGPLRKWYVSREEWPEDEYPNYCSGCAYGITVELVEKLYSVSTKVPFLWIDDIFVTGVLLGVVRKNYKWALEAKEFAWDNKTLDFRTWRRLCEKSAWDAKREFPEIAYVSRDQPELFERDMICLWNKTWHDSKSKF